ncbi:MAG TPA: ATP-binding protein [Myxococcales bacterium]|nr:ATP-binding protein [Myxococcales bacterium]
MDARTQSALLAAVVCLALAVAMLLRQGRTRLWTAFALLNLSLLAYELGDFVHGLIGAQHPWPLRLTLGAAGFVPSAVLGFIVEFQGESAGRAGGLRRMAAVTGVLVAAVAVSPLAMIPIARVTAAGAVFVQLTAAVSLLYARMRRAASRTERARLLYLWVGAALCVGLSFGELAIRLAGWPPPPFANVALTIYLYFLSQTIQRHRLLDLNELLGKIVVLAAVGVVLALIYGVLVRWTGGSSGLFLFNTMVASFVILILFEPLKAKVEEKVLAIFFAERFQFVQALNVLRQRMAGIIDVRELGQVVLDGFYETRRVTHASIYLLADDGLGYRRLDYRGPAPTPYIDAATVRALVQSAQTGTKAQLVELVERRLAELRQLLPESETEGGALAEERTRLSEIGAAMAAMRAGVTIPLIASQRVVGFLCLLDDRVTEAFASDELAAMLEIGDQAAITIENSRLYEKMKERDRLAALGEMAAGLAHEIRNPLGAIKGAAQYLDPAGLQPGDAEILNIIVEEVNRLDGVVAQFLAYSRPFPNAQSGKFQLTDLNDVLWKTMKLIESDFPGNVALELDLTPGLPQITADAEQLKQVFINLALNAVQAMPDGGRLTVRTRRPHAPVELALSDSSPRYSADQVEVRFADTGAGIPEDALDRIFIPFYTTKTKGTGLGLAISQRIVKGHGGTIEVQSRVGEGTEFILRFPSAVALDTAGRLGLTPSGESPVLRQNEPAAAVGLVGKG